MGKKVKWASRQGRTYETIKYSQAERIIHRFGGARKLMRSLKLVGVVRDAANIYRWTYPKSRGGTGGVIPTSLLGTISKAAIVQGIILKPEDFDPRERPLKPVPNQLVGADIFL
jgi:hypothetical protein